MPFQNEANNYYNSTFSNSQQQQQYMQQIQQTPRDDSLSKLKRLDEINATINKVSQTLIKFFDEITKDKLPPAKLKQAKSIFEESLNFLKKVETELLSEINNLNVASTGHPHEGSIYGARKDYDLTKMQLNLIGAQLTSLRESLDQPLKKDFYDSDFDTEEESVSNRKISEKEYSHPNSVFNGDLSEKNVELNEISEANMNF